MIDPKELRWGNYILLRSKDCKRPWTGEPMPDGDDFLLQVSKNFDWQLHGDKFTPIPLTDAVLEACCAGWEGRKYANFFDCTVSSLCVWYGKNEEGWILLSAYIGVEGVVVNVGPISLKGKYLHQLQNLYYALTGSELDIDGDKLAEAISSNP